MSFIFCEVHVREHVREREREREETVRENVEPRRKLTRITLKNNKIAMQEKLIVASQRLVSPMFSKTFARVSRKPCDEIFRPNRPFSCEATIITDVADVKPTVTGMEMKSISTPARKGLMIASLKIIE